MTGEQLPEDARPKFDSTVSGPEHPARSFPRSSKTVFSHKEAPVIPRTGAEEDKQKKEIRISSTGRPQAQRVLCVYIYMHT